MPGRSHPITTGNHYHVYNKTIDGKRPFENPRILQKFKEICWYYRSKESKVCFADFIRATDRRKTSIESIICDESSFRVNVLAYCIMPTHFHFLIQQKLDGGISAYTSQIQNSFTRYFNNLRSRKGPLFIQHFQSRQVDSEADIKHLSRYIHLNPYSCGYVSVVDEAFTYRGSSFNELTSSTVYPRITNGYSILTYFGNNLRRYREFVIQNAEYQKQLEGHK